MKRPNDIPDFAYDAHPTVGDVATMTEHHRSEKWCWMMDWCKRNGLPPAQEWAWQAAEQAWLEELRPIN